jgi:hypothetical protein
MSHGGSSPRVGFEAILSSHRRSAPRLGPVVPQETWLASENDDVPSGRSTPTSLDFADSPMYVPTMPAYGARTRLALRMLVIVALMALIAATAGTSVALELAPAALLVLPLLYGRYLGERVIHRLARRSPLVRRARTVALPRAPRSLGPRHAVLALSGAGRAPPAAAPI